MSVMIGKSASNPARPLIVLFLFLWVPMAEARDLFMTNKVRAGAFVKRSDPSKAVRPSGVDSFQDEQGNKLGKSDVIEKPCEFTERFFEVCGNLEYSEDVSGFFKDVAALPLANEAAGVKIGIIRYNMHFGGNLRIPFSLLSSNVSGSADQAKVNSLKLLDPDQGNLNLRWSYAGRYHLGQLCKFRKTGSDPDRGICTVGLNGGLRYLSLDKTTGMGTTASENAYGAYLEFANTFMFPVFEVGKDKGDAGQLAIKISASRFRQNIADSAVLFPNAVDAAGNPVRANKSYGGIGLTARLTVTDKLGIEASHFKPNSRHSPMDDITTFSLSYSID